MVGLVWAVLYRVRYGTFVELKAYKTETSIIVVHSHQVVIALNLRGKDRKKISPTKLFKEFDVFFFDL